MESFPQNQSILITGGTGSFGRKCAEILLEEFAPRRLAILSRDELKQHEMRQVFSDEPSSVVRYFIGDVRDGDRLRRAFHDVDVVIHAAALKQVPACEYNPFEAVQTNVIGARNVIEAAIDSGVGKVIALSTDKAVNPVNLYGATKLCAEKMFVQANAYSGDSGARFSVCRYGNVVGSRGSVIPLFRAQSKNGRVTITDERMTRFWLTLEQSTRFVLSCVPMAEGGEIFVPKIASMKVVDLATAIAPDCEVDFIGIRPGEKLHEVLVSEDEARNTVELEDRYVIQPPQPWFKYDGGIGGEAVAEGFRYTSDGNDTWLGADDLAAFIG